VAPLGRVLGRADRIDVQVAAVWALTEIGDPSAIPALLRAQADAVGPNPRLRYNKTLEFQGQDKEFTLVELIEDGIAQLGESVLSQYIKALQAPISEYETKETLSVNRRRSALAVIVCVGERDFRAVDMLLEVLQSPQGAYPKDFRNLAALGLARALHGRVKRLGELVVRDKTAERATKALSEYVVTLAPGRERSYIVGALSRSNPTYAVTLLTVHFGEGAAKSVRQRAIEVLGMLRSREATEALAWALKREEDPELRRRAAIGLGLCGKSEAAVTALRRAADDKSAGVRRAALTALARIDGEQAVPMVAAQVRDPDLATRLAATEALGLSKRAEAVPLLLIAAQDKEAPVRAMAVAALAGIPSRESLGAILKATRDRDREVRMAAVRVLARLHGEAVYAALVGLVGDPDRRIQSLATNALHLGKVQHVDELKAALIRVIQDPKHPASADACDFADFPKDKRIVEVLQQAQNDPRPAVRASARRMLDKMGLGPGRAATPPASPGALRRTPHRLMTRSV